MPLAVQGFQPLPCTLPESERQKHQLSTSHVGRTPSSARPRLARQLWRARLARPDEGVRAYVGIFIHRQINFQLWVPRPCLAASWRDRAGILTLTDAEPRQRSKSPPSAKNA